MPRIAYRKPALSIDDQIGLLVCRGLGVPDPARAAHYLRFVGYFRLSGYFPPFRVDPMESDSRFRDNAAFDDVLNLYVFDRKVRLLLMDAFERIEISVKAHLSNIMSTAVGPFWLSDSANFGNGQHKDIVVCIQDAIGNGDGRSLHSFINHYFQQYSEPPHPPSWMLMETLSFGSVSRVYKLLRGSHQKLIAEPFGLDRGIFESWLHALAFARNAVAHHSRVWNRVYTITPRVPNVYRAVVDERGRKRLFMICVMIHHIMEIIADGSKWTMRLFELLREHPEVSLEGMGFPTNWAMNKFWGLPPTTPTRGL